MSARDRGVDHRDKAVPTRFEEVVAAFGSTQVNVADLPEDDPSAKLGKACERLFTAGVDALRSFPNDRVRALGHVVWDLVGHKQVTVAIGPDVPSLSFTVMRIKELHQAIVLIPKQWPQMVKDDSIMQLGAILFVGAQVVDFYNDRLIGDCGAPLRWQAYEAELLRTIKAHWPNWRTNAYQHQILEKFPDGLSSKGVELYQIKPFDPPRGAA